MERFSDYLCLASDSLKMWCPSVFVSGLAFLRLQLKNQFSFLGDDIPVCTTSQMIRCYFKANNEGEFFFFSYIVGVVLKTANCQMFILR